MAEMHRPPAPPVTLRRVAGVDLGKRVTPATLAIVESTSGRSRWDAVRYGWVPDGARPERVLRYLAEFTLLTEYSEIAERVWRVVVAAGVTELCVDATGVGEAVVEMLRERRPAGAAGVRLRPVVLTGGLMAEGDRVPRRELMSRLALEVEQGRLKAARGLPGWAKLLREMRGLDGEGRKGKGRSDDLAMAVGLALWGSAGGEERRVAGERAGRLF